MTDNPSALAYVPVPTSLLPQALVAVAKLIDPDATDSELADDLGVLSLEETVHDKLGANGQGWTAEHLTRLADTPTNTTRLVGRLLDELANNPTINMPTSVLIARLGVAQPQLRGALGALTRHLKKHYPGLGWPMHAAWGTDLGEGHALETYYRLDRDVADTWKKVRENHQSQPR